MHTISVLNLHCLNAKSVFIEALYIKIINLSVIDLIKKWRKKLYLFDFFILLWYYAVKNI